MRIAVIINTVTPYTRPLFSRLAERDECELLVVTETPAERDRRWLPETGLSFEHVRLESWTLDLSRLAVGTGFKTRFDTYLYVTRRPLHPLRRFAPDVVVAAGGGTWSSPANIAALAARRKQGWAFVPWWGSFTRGKPTLPRRIADPWVRTFFRTADACLVYGSRHARDVIEMGADPDRTVIAPLTAVAPDPPVQRQGTNVRGVTRYLFIGRFIERKGIDVLVDAFRRLDAGELWIAGEGPLEDLVASAASADPRIRLMGYADGDGLTDLYRQADVLVVPSLYEPWGLVVHEGLAWGLPVIVTDQVAAGDDLIDPGVNGYVVPPGSVEALTEAMRAAGSWTKDEWTKSGRRSIELLETCSIDRAVDAYLLGCSLGLEHRRGTRGN